MTWTPELRDFIQQHINDDTAELLLAARRYQGIDIPFAVEQIEARKRLKTKLPEWYENAELVMGGRVPAEQCSSEATARYKRSIIEGKSLCDMTGGMGVDFWYMSEGMDTAIYTERNEELCEIAQHNFQVLKDGKHSKVEVRQGDGQKLPIPSVDIIYLDPARRAGDGSRVYAMEDCEPNIVEWQEELLQHAKMVLVKLSPMVDLTDVLRKLRHVTDIYIVGVKNECKEVLVKAPQPPKGEGCRSGNEVQIHCVDFLTDRQIEYTYTFNSLEETHRVSLPPSGVRGLLYEPDVTLMKAQAFSSLCHRYPVSQLDVETHLMTSDEFIADFPGRIFEVVEQIPFSSKLLKRLKKDMPQANIATRNFVMTADELRKRTGIKDGGEVYLFGAKVKDVGQMLLKCRKKVVTSHP
jgi:16S rRNA G966 N2-methylase RsmD